jgi:hypothetical protein
MYLSLFRKVIEESVRFGASSVLGEAIGLEFRYVV